MDENFKAFLIGVGISEEEYRGAPIHVKSTLVKTYEEKCSNAAADLKDSVQIQKLVTGIEQINSRLDEIQGLTSGHISVASGGLTPLINDQTLKLEHDAILSTNSSSMGNSSFYYLKLWTRVLKRKNIPYKIVVDGNRACLQRKQASAIIWFPIDNPQMVKCWYINFRLCNDDPVTFTEFESNHMFESMDVSITTPDSEIDLLPKYKKVPKKGFPEIKL